MDEQETQRSPQGGVYYYMPPRHPQERRIADMSGSPVYSLLMDLLAATASK